MKNLVLIGFMGSGKTEVGKVLATDLKLPFRDTDAIVENRCTHTVSKIFKNKGEDFFRQMESEVVEELSYRSNQVISCGGGVILRSENVENLKRNGTLIYFKALFEVLYERIKESTDRPLLQTEDPEETAKALLLAREKDYEMAADIIIEVGNRSIEEIAEEVKGLLDLSELNVRR